MKHANEQIKTYLASLRGLSEHTYRYKCSLGRLLNSFLSETHPSLSNILLVPENELLNDLKAWMLKNNMPLFSKEKRPDSPFPVIVKAPLIRFYASLVVYLITTADKAALEKDIWLLDRLDFSIRQNPASIIHRIDFRRIPQEIIRQETKAACALFLRRESATTVRHRVYAMNFFAQYLHVEYQALKSTTEVDRSIIEAYLVYMKTECTRKTSFASEIALLKGTLIEIGRIMNKAEMETLFLITDRPHVPIPLYRAYSSEELQRMHECIMQLPEQMARILIIHELLGTRISDTLALKQDALIQRDGHWHIRINQSKTQHIYTKQINDTLAELIKASIRFTNAHHPASPYVFASEKDPSVPIQYNTLRKKLLAVYRANDLRDDTGKPMSTGTHLFRHTFGQRLTEMNTDDLIIAKLLGHKNTSSVKHYRKISNHKLESETRPLRKSMDSLIRMTVSEWT